MEKYHRVFIELHGSVNVNVKIVWRNTYVKVKY